MTSGQLELVARARDPIALSTVQAGLSAFHTACGYVPYVERAATTLTLGAPVCAPSSMANVAAEFVEQFPRATFFYVTDEQQRQMALRHHHAWPVGADFLLPLAVPQHDERWPKEVSSALRKARRAGFTLREVRGEALAALELPMRDAQRAYLAGREVPSEMSFLTRPCLFSQEKVGRTFALELGTAFLGFIVVDPYQTTDGGQGYLLNHFRIGKTKLWGVYQATVAALVELLSLEGAAELSLGFVPLAPTEDVLPWWLKPQVGALRRLASRSPYLQGLARMKASFRTRQVPRYFVSRRHFIAQDVIAVLCAMGITSPLVRKSPRRTEASR